MFGTIAADDAVNNSSVVREGRVHATVLCSEYTQADIDKYQHCVSVCVCQYMVHAGISRVRMGLTGLERLMRMYMCPVSLCSSSCPEQRENNGFYTAMLVVRLWAMRRQLLVQ